MSSLMRWNANRNALTMSEALDRLFDEAFVMPHNGNFSSPNIDLVENEDNLVVKAEIPGFKPENVDIRVEGNLLSLRGEYHEESEKKEGQYHYKERRQNSFNRSIPLPVEVNAEQATAEFDNGVLTVTLPKNETAKPKRINITAKSGK